MTKDNVAVVRGIYEAFAAGDVAAVVGALHPEIVWNEAEGGPLAKGNPYVGPEAVVAGIFAPCATDWDGFSVTPEEFLNAGDTVVALGRYGGRHKATGLAHNTQMAHVWRIAGGKVVRFQQYADTRQLARVMGEG